MFDDRPGSPDQDWQYGSPKYRHLSGKWFVSDDGRLNLTEAACDSNELQPTRAMP